LSRRTGQTWKGPASLKNNGNLDLVSEDKLPQGDSLSIRELLVSTVAGFLTGLLSGLVGLGGSELRIPFILYVLGVPLREMVAANLLMAIRYMRGKAWLLLRGPNSSNGFRFLMLSNMKFSSSHKGRREK